MSFLKASDIKSFNKMVRESMERKYILSDVKDFHTTREQYITEYLKTVDGKKKYIHLHEAERALKGYIFRCINRKVKKEILAAGGEC